MENKTIDILMATYNGAKYIENQILSLMQQTYKNWKLFIQDDGSSDNTLDIINHYSNIDPRIVFLNKNKKNQGAGNNFLSMIKYSNADYAIFCDQDDIWLENKIADMVSFANLNSLDSTPLPGIIYTDGYAFSDETGNINFRGISNNHAERLNDFLFFNSGYQGCSILMNRPLKNIVSNYSGYVYLHDDIVCLIAHAFDNVHFLPKKLMLYRQHPDAVTGEKSFKNKGIISKIFDVTFLISRKHYDEKRSFIECYSELLNPVNKKLLEEYVRFGLEKNKFKKLLIILRNDFTLGGSKIKLIIKMFIRRGFDL